MYNTDAKHFDMEVVKASSAQPIVVLFHGPNCRPCATLKPILETITADVGVALYGVDASANRELVSRFGLRMVPTVMIFKDQALFSTHTGAAAEHQLRSWLAAAGVPPKVTL